MKWYHFSVEYFEDLRNVNHCEFLIMRKKEDSGKYILENNLRTWSELKRERLAAASAASVKDKNTPSNASEKDQEKEKKLLGNAGTTGTSNGEASSSSGIGSPIPVRKKWGGCPNGCDHGKHSYRKENSMHAMQLNGKSISLPPAPGLEVTPASSLPASQTLQMRRPAASRRWQSSSEEDEDDPRGRVGPPAPFAVDVERSLDELVSSPDGTPSFISVEDRLKHRMKSPRMDLLGLVKSGRDFGGSLSGHESLAGSDAELSAEEDHRKHAATGKGKGIGTGSGVGRSAMGMGHGAGVLSGNGKVKEEIKSHRGALADALGDQSDVGSDAGIEDEPDLDAAEKKDKSLKESVY
jgi:hypothetical protein